MKTIILILALLPACLSSDNPDPMTTEPEPTVDHTAGDCTFPDAPPLSAHIRDGMATITEAQWNAETAWRFKLAIYANCVNTSK